jgi:hypothetical protein
MSEEDEKEVACPVCGSLDLWVDTFDLNFSMHLTKTMVGDAWIALECKKCRATWTLRADNWKVSDLIK